LAAWLAAEASATKDEAVISMRYAILCYHDEKVNGAPMPCSRTEVAVAELGGKIYVVGGFSGERKFEIYDPAADRWRRGLPVRSAVGLNGKLYVLGGYIQGWSPTNAVYEYVPRASAGGNVCDCRRR